VYRLIERTRFLGCILLLLFPLLIQTLVSAYDLSSPRIRLKSDLVALKEGRLVKQAKLFGLEKDSAILTSLEFVKAEEVALQVEEVIKPLCEKLKIVGSIRRKNPKLATAILQY